MNYGYEEGEKDPFDAAILDLFTKSEPELMTLEELKPYIQRPHYIGEWRAQEDSGVLGISFWQPESQKSNISGLVIDDKGVSHIYNCKLKTKGGIDSFIFWRKETDKSPDLLYFTDSYDPRFRLFEGNFGLHGKFKVQKRENAPLVIIESADEKFADIYDKFAKEYTY